MKYFNGLLLVLFIAFPAVIYSQPNYPKNPEQAQIVSTDVKNFLDAYRKFSAQEDNTQVLQKFYFEKASPGLKEYISRFQLTPKMLDKAIKKNPDKYKRIVSFYGDISSFENTFKEEMKIYKKVIPNAMFAPTYLLVGASRGIGQASPVGQLVTIENRLDDIEKLKSTIIHELTHLQQAFNLGINKYGSIYAKKDNMLDLVLREGAADFITYKLVRKNVKDFTKLSNYQKNEFELWEKFKRDLNNQNKDFWLNVSFEDDNKGYPIQLGYAVGYKIVEAYYEKMPDKDQALSDILKIEDAKTFLAKSDYQPRLSKLQKELMFGKPHADAPEQIKDYHELIGISDCTSQQRKQDGTWNDSQNITWTFRYILEGTAVQDTTYKPDGIHSGSIREFDKKESKWYVHYFSPPSGASKVLSSWEGVRKADEMILYRPQKAPNGIDGLYKIRFYNINEKGFDWLGAWVSKDESFTYETWKISCKKREL